MARMIVPVPFASFSNVCCDLCDEEAVVNIAAFFGKEWQDVSVDVWEKHPSAITFFTTDALHYYLQSLVCCSKLDFEAVEMAVDSVLRELSPDVIGEIKGWRDSRWVGMSAPLRREVYAWMEFLAARTEVEDSRCQVDRSRRTLAELWR
jgi:hypothetical protein